MEPSLPSTDAGDARYPRLVGLGHRELTLALARADVFDYIERFYNPLIKRRLDAKDQAFRLSTQSSVETG